MNWNRRKAGRWFTFQHMTCWMVNLKYDSLNSRSLQIFKSSSQKTAAVIKNPKQHRSFFLPYFSLPKEGRKVSVVPFFCVSRAPSRQCYGVSIHVLVTVSPCSHQAAQRCFQSNSSVSMQQLQNDPGLQHARARKCSQNVAAQGRR